MAGAGTKKARKKSAKPVQRRSKGTMRAGEIADELMQISNGLWLERESFVRGTYRDKYGDFHEEFLKQNIEAVEALIDALDRYQERLRVISQDLEFHLECLVEEADRR